MKLRLLRRNLASPFYLLLIAATCAPFSSLASGPPAIILASGLMDQINKVRNPLPDLNLGGKKEPDLPKQKVNAPVTTPVQQLARQDIIKGVAAGAAAGAAAGYAISEMSGDDDSGEAILIGAGVGALGGFLAGNIAAQRRKEFATEQAYLEAEITDTQTAISTKERQIQAADARVGETQLTIAQLQRRRANNEDVSKELEAALQQVTEDIQGYDESLKQYEDSIEYLEDTLEKSEKKKADTAHEKAEIDALQGQLTGERNKLLAQFNRLNGIKEAAEQNQSVLIAMK